MDKKIFVKELEGALKVAGISKKDLKDLGYTLTNQNKVGTPYESAAMLRSDEGVVFQAWTHKDFCSVTIMTSHVTEDEEVATSLQRNYHKKSKLQTKYRDFWFAQEGSKKCAENGVDICSNFNEKALALIVAHVLKELNR